MNDENDDDNIIIIIKYYNNIILIIYKTLGQCTAFQFGLNTREICFCR